MYSEKSALSSVVNVTQALELANKPTTTKVLANMIAESLPEGNITTVTVNR